MALRTGDLLMAQFKKCPQWKNMTDEELVKLKKVMVSIASDYVSVCEKYNLKYIMGAGTCLGAVRHHGFIPWDDDMDFHMPRRDYMRLLEVAEKELGDKYYVRSISKGDSVTFPSTHIGLCNTRYVNYDDLIFEDEITDYKGIYIDVFPYDNVSSIKLLRNAKELISLMILYLCSCIHINKAIVCLNKLGVEIDEEAQKAFRLKRFIGKIAGAIDVKKWIKFHDGFISNNKHDESLYVNCYMGKKMNKYTHLRSKIFGELNPGEFEGHKWNLPTDVEDYLSKEYDKNYMTPPPESKRKIHPVFELVFPVE